MIEYESKRWDGYDAIKRVINSAYIDTHPAAARFKETFRDYKNYIDTDMAATKEAFKNYILEGKKMPTGGYSRLFGNDIKFVPTGSWNMIPKVKKIIHSGPCTIVFWEDNTKTIVRLEEGKEYDEYAAFTAALAKKVYGSNSKVHKILEKKTVEQKQKSKKEEKEC